MAQVDKLVKKYGLTERQRTALIALKDAATKPIGKILDMLAKTDKQRPNPIVDAHIERAMSAFGKVLTKAQEVDRQKPNPNVSIQDKASGPLSSIMSKLTGIDGFHAKSYVTNTITTVHNMRFNKFGPTGDPNDAAALPFPSQLRFAAGGMDIADRHYPEFAGPGPTRMWREPETEGESYIPHANDWRRPRAEAILTIREPVRPDRPTTVR